MGKSRKKKKKKLDGIQLLWQLGKLKQLPQVAKHRGGPTSLLSKWGGGGGGGVLIYLFVL